MRVALLLRGTPPLPVVHGKCRSVRYRANKKELHFLHFLHFLHLKHSVVDVHKQLTFNYFHAFA